jgi:Lrp/AsnC family transcriptional regulator, leucine-responsive regulatory protein
MDRLDRKILALHQNDTRRSAKSLGVEVGLSAAAVQRRLKSLRSSGAIRAEIALLDPTILGVQITCIVAISMAPSPAPHRQLDRFKRSMSAAAEVQQCYHVTGSLDFVVIVMVPTMSEFASFARKCFESDNSVARFDTHVVLDRVKAGLSFQVPAAER